MKIKQTFSLDALLESSNIAATMDADDLKYVGMCALDGYNEDMLSRQEWAERSRQAMELALQVVTQKTFPWQGASNVKFPLVTVAALQFQAMAYPAIVDPPDLVKCMVYGDDPDGSKGARADRIAAHMSWQNLEQDTGWEEAHDKGLLVQAIAGNCFIKKVYDPACRHNVTQLVLPENFVINYYTKDICSSPRYTHTFNLTDNDVRQREIDGRFVAPPNRSGNEEYPTLPKSEQPQDDPLKIARDERQGITPPSSSKVTPYFTGEQYCWWDFDGDGFAEPYIVTFDIGTGCVRRIVARYLPTGVKFVGGKSAAEFWSKERDRFEIPSSAEVYEIDPVDIFIKIPFVPSPDGGFYDLGLGNLLGPINESVNTALNQIFDAGTMATLGGGFLGRGFKNRGGPFTFRPFEWYPIDAPGDDLRKNILPLPVREPSNVLFQVLGLLIQYGERIISTNEIQAGENPGQNTPAETTRTLDANGRRMANAVYKRTWRSFRDEYRIQWDLNAKFLPDSENFHDLTTGQGAMIQANDYRLGDVEVRPAADPYIISDAQKREQAMALLQMSQNLPGFNRYQTTLRALKAMKVQDIATIYQKPTTQDPQGKTIELPDFPPAPNPKMMEIQIKQQQLQLDSQEMQGNQQEMKMKLILLVQETGAKIENLQAQSALYIAQGKSEEAEPMIKLIYAQIETERSRRDQLLGLIDTIASMHVEHKKLAMDAKEKGVNMPQIQGPMDTIAQTNGAMLGSLQ